MRKIINPWVRMAGYNCFGCSPLNPLGLHMHFYEEDPTDLYGDIVSVWQPGQDHQSWINTLHGGVQATLLDEICGWVVFKKLNTSGVTAKMEIRYKNAISTVGTPLILRARLKSHNHRVAVVEGEIRQDDTVCATAECTYFSFPQQKAKEMGFVESQLEDNTTTIEELLKTE